MNINPNDYAIRISTGLVYEVEIIDNTTEQVTISRIGDQVTESLTISSFEKEFAVHSKGTDTANSIDKYVKVIEQHAESKILCFDAEKDVFYTIDADKFTDELIRDLDKVFENLISKPKEDRQSKAKVIRRNVPQVKDKSDTPKTVPPRRKVEEDQSENFLIIKPSDATDLSKIILHEKTKKMVDQSLCKIELSSFLDEEWGFKDFAPIEDRCLLNFFGPPGTGKTLMAKAISKKINKNILQVDYSNLISKWVGDTGKNIKNYFQKATKENLILFFDEADALLMPRSGGGSTEQYNIQNQNIFMQEVDRFKGVLILTTNNFKQYDEAMLRRFDHIPFDLPNKEMRAEIIKGHISSKILWEKNFDFNQMAIDTEGFSGGDIKNVIANGLINKARDVKNANADKFGADLFLAIRESEVQYIYLLEEIDRIKKIRKQHGSLAESRVSLGLISSSEKNQN